MENLQEFSTSLEDLLVKEFRSLQSLIALTKDEHTALTKADASALLPLVEDKEVLLDEISQLEDSRRMITEEMAKNSGLEANKLTLNEIISRMEPGVSGRLGRLHEGILTLVKQAKDLSNANRILATTTLEWLDATQVFLLSLYQPSVGYQPPGVPTNEQQGVVWDVDHRA